MMLKRWQALVGTVSHKSCVWLTSRLPLYLWFQVHLDKCTFTRFGLELEIIITFCSCSFTVDPLQDDREENSHVLTDFFLEELLRSVVMYIKNILQIRVTFSTKTKMIHSQDKCDWQQYVPPARLISGSYQVQESIFNGIRYISFRRCPSSAK